jgi:hypothetical protein
MEGYELTERGKIVIAVVLVLLFLLVPSAIMLYNAMASQAPQPPTNQESGASGTSPPVSNVTPPPTISESPPPNGGGFNPPGLSPPNGNGQGPDNPHGIGQAVLDSTEGVLSFLFSPHLQNALDAETSSMLDRFLGLPKNTQGSMIAVEMPQLPSEDTEKVISVIAGAFSARGVSEQRLAYITYPTEDVEGPFAIKLSYTYRPK